RRLWLRRLLTGPAMDRSRHPLQEVVRRQAAPGLGRVQHRGGLPGGKRVLVRQRGTRGFAVLEQVLDVPVELLGIVVHDILPRSRPARFSARNCRTLTFASLRLSSWAVSRTE